MPANRADLQVIGQDPGPRRSVASPASLQPLSLDTIKLAAKNINIDITHGLGSIEYHEVS